MPRITTTSALALPILALLLSFNAGCVAGNTTRIEKPTTGRELIELKEALDRQAITEAEYENQKARLLGMTSPDVAEVRSIEAE